MENPEYDNPDLAFSEGFKTGYIMAEESPDLLKKTLIEREGDHDRHSEGMREGQAHYLNRQKAEQMKSIARLRNTVKERDEPEQEYE